MKVLEKGEGWNLKVKCTGSGNGDGGCGSLLLVEENDIYVTAKNYYDGSTDLYFTFCCPVCGTETDICENNVPSRIRSKCLNDYKEKIKSLGR